MRPQPRGTRLFLQTGVGVFPHMFPPVYAGMKGAAGCIGSRPSCFPRVGGDESSRVWHLQYSVSQAVARFMLTHEVGADYLLQTALTILGVPAKHQARATRQIFEDETGLAETGVIMTGEHVRKAEPTRTVSEL